jgi:hypothetical protein
MQNNLPYPECKKCKDLGDCKHPDISDDMMGNPLPPDNCPCPIFVMKETIKKRKSLKQKNG